MRDITITDILVQSVWTCRLVVVSANQAKVPRGARRKMLWNKNRTHKHADFSESLYG